MKNEVKNTNEVNSTYKTNVIEVNQAIKNLFNSLGAIRSFLITNAEEINLPKEFKKVLEQSKKDEKIYKELLTFIRVTKKGKFNYFYTLQGLQKFCNK